MGIHMGQFEILLNLDTQNFKFRGKMVVLAVACIII
jgi:hypothetical protein